MCTRVSVSKFISPAPLATSGIYLLPPNKELKNPRIPFLL